VSWRCLIGVLEIFDRCPQIFGGCPGDIWWVSWLYLMFVLEIFDWCPGDISWVSWRFFMGVLEIFHGCIGDI